MAQQQQQYFQYTAQPDVSFPGATVYTYPGAQQPQPGAASTTAPKNEFYSKGGRVVTPLATIQFIIGFCVFIFYVTLRALEWMFDRSCAPSFDGAGIGCGIVFMMTSTTWFSARKKNSTKLITTFMVMSVVCAVAVWIVLAFAVVSIKTVDECQEKGISFYVNIPDTIWIPVNAVIITLAAIEFIIAVTSAVYSGRAVCSRCVNRQPESGVHVATTVQLPSQQQQHPIVEESHVHHPAARADPTDSYYQPSYAQPMQPPYYHQQQQMPLLDVNSQNTYGPFAATSETAIREAAPSGADQPGPQAYYAPTAGDSNAVHSVPELPPSYNAAIKL